MTSTWPVRQQQVQGNLLGSHVDAYSEPARVALDPTRAAFMASGADPATATQRAYTALFGTVGQQAAMLSFVQIFRTLGLIFIVMDPLLLVTRRPRHQRGRLSSE